MIKIQYDKLNEEPTKSQPTTTKKTKTKKMDKLRQNRHKIEKKTFNFIV